MSTPSRRQVLAAGLNVLAAGPLTGIANTANFSNREGAYEAEKIDPIDRENSRLWYQTPAEEWTEALPIGNGRLGAMIYGAVPSERVQLNESTIWAGGPHNYDNPEALGALPEIRRLIFDGKITEAQDLANGKFMSVPLGQLQYQTAGELHIDFDNADHTVSGYERELDIDSAVHRVTYSQDGVRFTREAFASFPDQVVVIHVTSDAPDAISFIARFESPQRATAKASETELELRGISTESEGIAGQVTFIARAKILTHGGKVVSMPDRIRVERAKSATIILGISTNFVNYRNLTGDPLELVKKHLQSASKRSYQQLRRAHVEDHQRLYHRVSLHIEAEVGAGSTEDRIDAYQHDQDPSLAALYFNYGRYLMIACSRPGGKPATLQGIWNDSLTPPWGSKYTTNINTEMNYWPVETCNLSECHEPLFDLILDIAETGQNTAKVHYGARGWVLHHNTDQWRGTAPIDGAAWGIWPTGGAWLSTHLWQHYLFTGNVSRLKQHYPLMKGAAEFFVDTLVSHPEKRWLVTCPSASPENSHHPGEGLCAGPTMDMQIIRDLFEACIEASVVLGIDPDFRSELESLRAKLAPMQIGGHGQLQEWLDDWDQYAPEQHHRHVSHLYGLFPSHQITPTGTPALFAAARKSLEIRGDEGTGWSLAWKINLWARLLEGDHALKLVKDALRPVRSHRTGYSGGGGVYPNLFDAHPPFQIDGNFGFSSGVVEMLLQSHAGELHLLPALPTAWPKGHVRGLRARGGIEVSLAWIDGKLRQAWFVSSHSQEISIHYGNRKDRIHLENGKVKTIEFKEI